VLRYYIFICFFILSSIIELQAQVLNNFTQVNTTPGTSIYVNGGFYNAPSGILKVNTDVNTSAEFISNDFINNGVIEGSGIYKIRGNWINNYVFNHDTSTVNLEGASQIIGGGISTYFYNLTLSGSGNKTQTLSHYVKNILNLNDKELLTEHYSMFILNTDIGAIERSSGFVSSIDTGKLVRATALNDVYLFPVGSSVGTQRYRPVEIEPLTADTNTYTVRLANVDATSEGFDRSLLHNEICNTNPLFYHRINRIMGNAAVNLTVYYDEPQDGVWDGLSHWTSGNLWEAVSGSTTYVGAPLNKAYKDNWNNFSETPYILYVKNASINLGNDTVLCAGQNLILDAGSGFDTYFWNTTASTQTISIDTSGIYIVTVTKGSCIQSDTIQVTFNPIPIINLGNDTTICDGDYLRLDAGTGFMTYNWSTGDTTQIIDVFAAGSYTVVVTDMFGCSGNDNISVSTLSYNASIDYVGDLCYDDLPVSLTAVDTGGLWSGTGITDAINGIFDPSIAGIGVHTISYIINKPCGDTGTFNVNVINCDPYEPHAVVPDIFSPNGDGENDVLYVRGEGIETLYFAIYTRWGEKVFETSTKDKGWNGSFREKPLDPAVFVYHLMVTFIDKTELKQKGEITLVR